MRRLLHIICVSAALGWGLGFPAVSRAREPAHSQVRNSVVFKDCANICPAMVRVAPGQFLMGSPDSEPGRNTIEGPQHQVRIGYSFALSQYPITVGEFRNFVEATKYDAGSSCFTNREGQFGLHESRNWENPDFPQQDNHPVVCISWDDAQAYVKWLSEKTGKAYRLPSEAEYEYANRAGTSTSFWWGDDAQLACDHANLADLDFKARFPGRSSADCRDGFAFTSPVGSFKPNAFGLYDTTGNVWVWTQDCSAKTYASAPSDGTPDASGDCSKRVVRGGSWNFGVESLRSASRGWSLSPSRVDRYGIRVVRTLGLASP